MPENEELKNDASEKGSGTPPDTSALFNLLGKLLSNQSTGQSSQAQSAQDRPAAQFYPNNTEEQSESKSSGEGDILSSLLSNPELLSKLPQLLSVVGPLMGNLGGQKGPAESKSEGKKPENSLQTDLPSPQAHISKEKKDADCRAALLCAMKPYLGKDRQNAIDYMIKLSRLGDILKTL